MKKFVLFIVGCLLLTSCGINRKVASVDIPRQVITEYHILPEMKDLSINGIVYLIYIDRSVDVKTGRPSLQTQYHWVYDCYYGKAADKMAINSPVMFNN